ncbi:MAG: accessory factor UbiK family protein [Gammaproteobacteria bacterium]|nr:accessory factor UbiK family protein [Gammaproteobacteria bacterium]
MLVDRLIQLVSDAVPQGLGEEVRGTLRARMQSVLDSMDLVTREELEVQEAVLARTREKLEALEAQVASLEERAKQQSQA